MGVTELVLRHPLAYRLLQAPIADKKLMPLFTSTDLSVVRRVLDVGCGPGTNAKHFAHVDYVGIDLNGKYTAWARRRYGREFITADATTYRPPLGSEFDLVLVNSFLHHIDDDAALHVLRELSPVLADGGAIHMIEVVMPGRRGSTKFFAERDRGKFIRPLSAWRGLFEEVLDIQVFHPYVVGTLGLAVADLVYAQGRPRSV